MDKRQKRREFVYRLALALMAVITLGALIKGRNRGNIQSRNEGHSGEKSSGKISPDGKYAGDGPKALAGEGAFEKALKDNRAMPRELVHQMLDQQVNHYMDLSHHCAQSSFLALKEQFSLDGDEVVKALSPLPGIAEQGLTCGALTGPLMAMGLIYGRSIHQLDQWDLYQSSLEPAVRLFKEFEEAFGTTLCHEVQEGEFGRCYHLTDAGELAQFQNDGATEKCSAVVRKAVRLAADIILDDPELG